MGSGASSTTGVAGGGTSTGNEGNILAENELVDQTKNYLQVIKGSPACRTGYDIGYKIGE